MTALPSDSAQGGDESFTPPQLRLLKRLVAVMGFVLVFGFLALVMAIVWKSNRLADGRPVALSPEAVRAIYGATPSVAFAEAAIPAGARLSGSHLAGDRLILVYEDAGGTGIAQIDVRSGKLVAYTRLGTRGPD